MADIEMTLRGRILLLVPIYLLVGGFLLQNPYLSVISTAILSLFIYSRYHFGRTDKEIQIESELSNGEKYAGEKFFLTQNIFSKLPLYFELEIADDDDIKVITNKKFSGTIYPNIEVKHELVPKSRGYKKIGALKGHIYDSMKLYKEKFYKEGDQEVTVHSSKEAIKRAQRYAKRIKSEILIKDFSRFKTRTPELDTIRDYQPGDRMRDIHWKSISKFQKLMTKTYEKRVPMDCQILLDCSPSMRRGVKNREGKLEHSIFITLELLKNFELSGHDFGLTVFDHKRTIYHHPPDHKRETFQKIYKDLSNLPVKIEVDTEGYERTNYEVDKLSDEPGDEAFTRIVGDILSRKNKGGLAGIFSAVDRIKKVSRSSLVIIFSDLETSTNSFIKAIEDMKHMDMEVWTIIPFSPWYLVEEISDEKLEDTYEDFEKLEKVIHELQRLEVSTFLLHPSTEGINILRREERIRR